MNYTQKKSSCEVNYTPIIDKSQKIYNHTNNNGNLSSLLGNREVGCKLKTLDI